MRTGGVAGATARANLPVMIVFAASPACLPNMRRRSMAHLTAPERAFLYAPPVREHPMSNAVILTDISGGIGTITLNKPWKLNAWDTPMRAERSEERRVGKECR